MTGSSMLHIRKAEPRDAGAIAAILLPTIRAGATYALDPDMSEAESLSYWMAPDKETFVAEEDGVVLGTYYMRLNQAGGGRGIFVRARDGLADAGIRSEPQRRTSQARRQESALWRYRLLPYPG